MSQSRVAPVNSERIVRKMADFDKIVRKHVNDDGNIPADSIPALVQSIQKTVGESFVTMDTSGTDSPRSHFDTALSVTPSRSAR